MMRFRRENGPPDCASNEASDNLSICRFLRAPRPGVHVLRTFSRFLRGFTLIEIMIALSIAMIVMTIGIPSFVRALTKEGLRKAVSDVVEGCSHARSQAILRGIPTEFVIRAEDMSISVRTAARNDGGWFSSGPAGGGSSSGPSKPTRFSSRFPEDVAVKLLYVNLKDKMELPEATVRFYPNGTCDEFTMILFSGEGEKKISLDIVTALSDVEVIR